MEQYTDSQNRCAHARKADSPDGGGDPCAPPVGQAATPPGDGADVASTEVGRPTSDSSPDGRELPAGGPDGQTARAFPRVRKGVPLCPDVL